MNSPPTHKKMIIELQIGMESALFSNEDVCDVLNTHSHTCVCVCIYI